jgi:maleate cis-trans isomerase
MDEANGGRRLMKVLGLISPNLDDPTVQEYYRILPEGIEIKGRPLHVEQFTDEAFAKVEEAFVGVVRDLAREPMDFLMVTGELFLSYRGPGSDRQVLETVKKITPVPDSSRACPEVAERSSNCHGVAVSRRPG